MKDLIAHLLHANSKWLLIAVAMLACTGAGLSISFPTLYGVPILAVVPVIAWMIRKSFSQARTSPVPNLIPEGGQANQLHRHIRSAWLICASGVTVFIISAMIGGILDDAGHMSAGMVMVFPATLGLCTIFWGVARLGHYFHIKRAMRRRG